MASSDDDIEQTESAWQDWNSEDAGEGGAVSLFDATRWPDAEAALAHDAAAHGFDLRSFRSQVRSVPLMSSPAGPRGHTVMKAERRAVPADGIAGL